MKRSRSPFSLNSHNLIFFAAGHPIPDQRGVAGARRIAQLLEQATDRDLVIALISGGGSALLTLPAEGIGLAELQTLAACCCAAGRISTRSTRCASTSIRSRAAGWRGWRTRPA